MEDGAAMATERRVMSAKAVRVWRETHGMSGRAAAEALGYSRNALRVCEEHGAPLHIALACAAISAGIKPILHYSDITFPIGERRRFRYEDLREALDYSRQAAAQVARAAGWRTERGKAARKILETLNELRRELEE